MKREQSETSKLIKRINEQIRQFERKGLTDSPEFRQLIKPFKDLGMGHKGLDYAFLPSGTPIIKNTASNRAIIETDPIITNFVKNRDKVKLSDTIQLAKKYLKESIGMKNPTLKDVREAIKIMDITHEMIELTKQAIYKDSKYSEWVHKSAELTSSEHFELMMFMLSEKQKGLEQLENRIHSGTLKERAIGEDLRKALEKKGII